MDPRFYDRITEQVTQSAAQTEWQAPWQHPAELSSLQSSQVTAAFDRVELGEAFADVLNSKQASGIAISLRLQADTLSAMERAYRTRHASVVRCLAHSAAARGGNGHPAGAIAKMKSYVQDFERHAAGAPGSAP